MSEVSGSLDIDVWNGNEVRCYEFRQFEIRVRKKELKETLSDHHEPFKYIKDLDELLEGIQGNLSQRNCKDIAKKMLYFIKRSDNIAPSAPSHFNDLVEELEEVIEELKDK